MCQKPQTQTCDLKQQQWFERCFLSDNFIFRVRTWNCIWSKHRDLWPTETHTTGAFSNTHSDFMEGHLHLTRNAALKLIQVEMPARMWALLNWHAPLLSLTKSTLCTSGCKHTVPAWRQKGEECVFGCARKQAGRLLCSVELLPGSLATPWRPLKLSQVSRNNTHQLWHGTEAQPPLTAPNNKERAERHH